MADFTGFYFDNEHSSTYHLLRVSNGDRYEEELFPQFDDRTVELVGGYGNLYDGTRFKEKEFSVPVVFDNLSERDFRNLRKWLEPNKVKEFRFDERPYKAYWAKLKSPPKFEYVCFMKTCDDEFNAKQERVYKGEATLEFIAYNPFGYCNDDSTKMTDEGIGDADGINWQSLSAYSLVNMQDDNLVEWAAESGLKSSAELERYNVFEWDDSKKYYAAKLYNPGDFEADFELYLPELVKNDSFTNIDIDIFEGEEEEAKYHLRIFVKELIKKDPNTTAPAHRIYIDTKKHLLKLILDKSANLRYDLITEKTLDWLKVPTGNSVIRIKCTDESFEGSFEGLCVVPEIKYGYKYY